ncbi:MAG: hypothetical protein P8076_08475 [Gammaproteobacteria bacterium]
MSDSDDERPDLDDSGGIVPFPQSRTQPPRATDGVKQLGLSKRAQSHKGVQPGLKGHWCSRCKGIWYGYVGEVECPVCGNRNG